jgi:ribosomal protein S7
MCIECVCVPVCNCREHDYGKRFLTKAEKTQKLKNYAEELKKELAAIEENINDISS